MSLGLFAAGSDYTDIQNPHGKTRCTSSSPVDVDGRQHPVARGSISYVPRGVPHHFQDTSDNLQVLVVFAPPLA